MERKLKSKNFCAVCLEHFPKEELIVYGSNHYFLCSPCKADVNRLGRFGLSPSDFELILKLQGYKCGICQQTLQLKHYKFAVDHCHDSEDVRGILCRGCNVALGGFKDDPDNLMRAAEYLNNPPALGVVKRHSGRKKVTFLRAERDKMSKAGN